MRAPSWPRTAGDDQRQLVFDGEQLRQPSAEGAITPQGSEPSAPSSQKSILIGFVRKVAGVALAKEANPIEGETCIRAIAPSARQNTQASCHRPGPSESLRHADAALRLEPGNAVGDQDIGLV